MAGGLIGLAAGGVLGYAGSQLRQKHEQEQQLKQFQYKTVFDEIQQNPNAIDNPEFVKHARKLFGDSWDMLEPTFKVHAAAAKRQQQQSQQIMQQLLGWGGVGMPNAPPAGPLQASAPGSPAPAPAAGGSPAPQPAAMDGAGGGADYDTQIEQAEKVAALLPGMGLDPEIAKSTGAFITNHIKELQSRRAIAEREKLDSPEAKARAKRAEELAGLAPDITAGKARQEAAVAGARSSAETNARIGAETSPKNLEAEANLAGAKAAAEESARTTVKQQVAAKADKPWTPKDALAARKTALDQAKIELTKPGWFHASTPPTPRELNQKAQQILASEGLDPVTGRKLKDGDKITIGGKTLTWKN